MSVNRVELGWDYADLLDRILDKGIVMDNAGRIRLPDKELTTSDDQVIVRSADTYLDKAA